MRGGAHIHILLVWLALGLTPGFSDELSELRHYVNPLCNSALKSESIELNWPELPEEDYLLPQALEILNDPYGYREKLARQKWSGTIPSKASSQNLLAAPLRYEVLPCLGKNPSRCRTLVTVMGIGYGLSRFKRQTAFLKQWRTTHNIVYVEMPGQGESWLLRLTYLFEEMPSIQRRQLANQITEILKAAAPFRESHTRTSRGEIQKLAQLSEKLGHDLFGSASRDWIRIQFRDLHRHFFAAVETIMKDHLKQTPDRAEFLGLSWGGWFLSSALAQQPPFHGRSLTLLDSGFGWLGTLINPLYQKYDSQMQTWHNTVDTIKSTVDHALGFMMWPMPQLQMSKWLNHAHLLDDSSVSAEVSEVHKMLAKHSREYLLDPVSRAGAVAMTMILREQNSIELAKRLPTGLPIFSVISPDGMMLPPRLQTDFANRLSTDADRAAALWLKKAPHDLLTADAKVQRLIKDFQNYPRGRFIAVAGDQTAYPADDQEVRAQTESAQSRWEETLGINR